MNKLNLIGAILLTIAAVGFAILAILLVGYNAPFWLIAMYAVCSSVDGINALLYFKLWRRLRRGG